MQFFYIDYLNNGKKERNIGFLRVENDGVSVGLRGVPAQCGDKCKVYAINKNSDQILLGEIAVKNGYGMEKLKWNDKVDFARCMRVEIPLYGTRKGECILRNEHLPIQNISAQNIKVQNTEINDTHTTVSIESTDTQTAALVAGSKTVNIANKAGFQGEPEVSDIYEELHEDKWKQLMNIYPQVHICSGAQSIVIRPKDTVILTEQYHELATNSFVLHAYYNYRQLLLFRYNDKGVRYYLGVPGIYYEKEQRIARMFGFEGFENGEARMQQDADNKIYRGCFGYYMKHVEI